jgi:hypothetical protein
LAPHFEIWPQIRQLPEYASLNAATHFGAQVQQLAPNCQFLALFYFNFFAKVLIMRRILIWWQVLDNPDMPVFIHLLF